MWTMQLTAQGRFSTPQEFANIIIRSKPDGSIVRLNDVAKVELGSSNYEFFGRVNGKPAAMIGIFADVNANALDTSAAVAEKIEKLSHKFPAGLKYDIPYDTTDFVKISIEEVLFTLFASIILVSLVIYLFLQSARASLIPVLSIPISLTGAFIGMYLLGYSINTLTLFGLVLAIGIVVDDAIVVVENMERILQTENLSPREAAIKAMRQISGPVIAIVLVMCAVFIPATFMGGMTGQLYKQFAATIAISVIFSGFMALTFAPSIGALILKHHTHEPARFFQWFNRKFAKMTDNYVRRSGWMIRKSLIFLVIYLSTYFFIGFFHKTLPSAFLPMEDQGYFITSITLPDGATANRTLEVVKQVEAILGKQEGIHRYTAITGLNILTFSQEPNAAVIFTRLKPWDERTTKELALFGILGTVGPKLGAIKEAKVFAMPPPPIRGMGPSDMFSLKLLQPGDSNVTRLYETTHAFVDHLAHNPAIVNPFSTMSITTPTLKIEVDREKAKTLGLSIADIFQTIQATIGYVNINQFDKNGKTYWVQMQSDSPYRMTPEDIGRAWLRSSNGQMVPLSSVITVTMSSAPSSIEHFNGTLSTTVMGSPAPGHSSGEIINIIDTAGETILPSYASYDWEGLYLQEKLVGSKSLFIIAFALVMVYLILAALYERWTLPISIMLAVPYGIMGAYAVVWLIPWLNNNVFFQIGLLTLIALSAKNAILVVEFAEEQRHEGKSIYDASLEAARLRYRPMMMTSFAFLAGMLPLIFSSGAGAGGRFSIGVAMFGGMLAATFIERYFIPYLYYWVATVQEKIAPHKEDTHEH
jgi:HAE1 family hydrophobic/amphiphilic exporter-1/multidrug efflux pump